MMKIKYHISQKTSIDRKIILKRIISELDKSSYIIFDVTENSIEFRNKFWLISSRSEYFGKVDGGKFTMSSENNTVVNFHFYASIWPELLLISFFVIFSFIQDYHICFLILPILIMFFFRIINIKSVGNEMIKSILNPVGASSTLTE